MRAITALFLLLFSAVSALADERADAIDRILPGTGIRLTTSGGTVKGHFITNRADSLFLRTASQRISLSYEELHQIEVRDPSTEAGIGFGAAIGGITGALVGTGVDESVVAPVIGGILVGGVLGGLIGKGIDHWVHVYPAKHSAPPDTTTKRR